MAINRVLVCFYFTCYSVRSAMPAASQLPGRGPVDVDDVPAPACLSKIQL